MNDEGESGSPCCRICQSTEQIRSMIRPCKCSGSLAYVHIDCLNQWRTTSVSARTTCSICNFTYQTKPKPAFSIFSYRTLWLLTSGLLGWDSNAGFKYEIPQLYRSFQCPEEECKQKGRSLIETIGQFRPAESVVDHFSNYWSGFLHYIHATVGTDYFIDLYVLIRQMPYRVIRIVCVWQLPRLIGMAINAVEQRNSNGMVEIIDLHDTTDIGIHMELPRAKEIHEESVTDDNG